MTPGIQSTAKESEIIAYKSAQYNMKMKQCMSKSENQLKKPGEFYRG